MPSASDVFAAASEQGRMTFMPFITAGDPDLDTTACVLRGLADCEVDLIELGFPYSDPIADGSVIQASYTRALSTGITIDGIFQMLDGLPTDTMPPVFSMVSFAIVYRYGVDDFLCKARDSGFSGLIIPDLPADEAGDFSQKTQQYNLDLVQLIAPTTTTDRTSTILSAARGFVYCISVAGTTGIRNELPDELAGQLKELRRQTTLPLAVGFGISSPIQVAKLEGYADGIIVGSAIVRLISEANSSSAAVDSVKEFARGMNAAAAAVQPSSGR
ncbi:MAG: tryptophan synthase subunit alpha [Fuerstiella sp.]|nr:tryptophan synthase subunit alpha [Fuerstiella sp.]